MVVVFLGPLKTFGKTTRIKISKKLFLHVIEQAMLASMKQEIYAATWWRYISGRKFYFIL